MFVLNVVYIVIHELCAKIPVPAYHK